MKAYISIPITGHDYDRQKERAETIKAWLQSMGHEAVTPFEVCPDRDAPYNHCMGLDIEALLGCKLIVMLPGWEMSRGCSLEKEAAEIFGLARMEINSIVERQIAVIMRQKQTPPSEG